MRDPIPQHPAGRRLQVAGHMCPECGVLIRPFCPVCLGAGIVTTERLGRWQREQDDIIAAGGGPA